MTTTLCLSNIDVSAALIGRKSAQCLQYYHMYNSVCVHLHLSMNCGMCCSASFRFRVNNNSLIIPLGLLLCEWLQENSCFYLRKLQKVTVLHTFVLVSCIMDKQDAFLMIWRSKKLK